MIFEILYYLLCVAVTLWFELVTPYIWSYTEIVVIPEPIDLEPPKKRRRSSGRSITFCDTNKVHVFESDDNEDDEDKKDDKVEPLKNSEQPMEVDKTEETEPKTKPFATFGVVMAVKYYNRNNVLPVNISVTDRTNAISRIANDAARKMTWMLNHTDREIKRSKTETVDPMDLDPTPATKCNHTDREIKRRKTKTVDPMDLNPTPATKRKFDDIEPMATSVSITDTNGSRRYDFMSSPVKIVRHNTM